MSPSVGSTTAPRRWLKAIGLTIVLAAMIYLIGDRSYPGGERYISQPLTTFQVEGRIVRYTVAGSLGGRLYVTNAGGQLYALIGRDPADRCIVIWDRAGKFFKSTCKGGTYALDGAWRSGPADRGLDRFATSIDKDVLVIDTQTVIPGPPAAAHP